MLQHPVPNGEDRHSKTFFRDLKRVLEGWPEEKFCVTVKTIPLRRDFKNGS